MRAVPARSDPFMIGGASIRTGEAIRIASMRLDVVIVSFPTQRGAVSAFSASPDDAPWRQEVAFVERHHNGRVAVRGTFAGHYVDIDESDHTSEPGAFEGALTGAFVGAVFGLGPPGAAFGFVFGGTVGAVAGRPTEIETEPQMLVDELRGAVPEGGSAVVLLAAPEHVDALLDDLAGAAGEVTRRALSDGQTAAIESELKAAPIASSGPSQRGDAAGGGEAG
jgi:uncharacterized membrane protein